MHARSARLGFTLIELSIVLVIIGLIVGGILVGQDLIRAAAVRAQVTQIEKFNTAVNTFRIKYGYIPGDIKDPEATSFGFAARGPNPGQGDGNGIISAFAGGGQPLNGASQQCEATMFWLDLSTARLMDGAVQGASATSYGVMPFSPITFNTTPSVNTWFPTAQLQSDNFVQVYSNGGVNYFAISAVQSVTGGGNLNTSPSISVRAAAAIDSKMDDGLPQSGNVTAMYITGGFFPYTWAGTSDTSATSPSASTCYDNGNVSGATQKYSLSQNGGSGANCALSFKLQ